MTMPNKFSSILEIPELRTPFVFRRRPTAIPADLRPAWRIGLIVLLLERCCRGGRTSLARLHVLSWGFRSPEGRAQLLAVAEGRVLPDALIVRFEPFLIQAVDFALAESLIQRDGGSRIKLTASGKTLAKELATHTETFATEKRLMSLIRTKVSEELVTKLLTGRSFK